LGEGAAIRYFKFPDRVVVGISDERGRKLTGSSPPLSLNQALLVFTESHAVVINVANAFVATKFSRPLKASKPLTENP
jgi:UDPglucose 6-dehydrogenase